MSDWRPGDIVKHKNGGRNLTLNRYIPSTQYYQDYWSIKGERVMILGTDMKDYVCVSRAQNSPYMELFL